MTALTRELGLVSFIVPDGKGKAAARRRAILLPGSCFEASLDIRANRQLQTFSDAMPSRPMIIDNPVKSALLLFACDFLNTLLRENQPDTTLFDYVDYSMAHMMASRQSIANWPVCFLIGLQRHMGIEPDAASFREGALFDMVNGRFLSVPSVDGRYLDPMQSAHAALLARMNLRNMHHFRYTRQQRAELLDILLEYYSIHCAPVTNLSSLPILRSIFQ